MIAITLEGEPKSTQHCYKTACRGSFPSLYMSAECKAIKEDYQWQAKGQYHGVPVTDELVMYLTLYHKTSRRSDIDNFSKLILDALTGIVYEDDNQIAQLTVERRQDKHRPRAEAVIHKLDGLSTVSDVC